MLCTRLLLLVAVFDNLLSVAFGTYAYRYIEKFTRIYKMKKRKRKNQKNNVAVRK